LKIAVPFVQLIEKKIIWNEKAKCVFQVLRQAFTLTPIIVHTNLLKPLYLEANALNFALDSVLLLHIHNRQLHPIIFHYIVGNFCNTNQLRNKQLLTRMVNAFENWHHLLEGAQHTIAVYLDYNNPEYLMSVF